MIPTMDALAPSGLATWLGVAILTGLSVWLFRLRQKLRTTFFLPLVFAPLLAAAHFRASGGTDTTEFAGALLAFIVICAVAGLSDAFWSPGQDDLENLEYLQRSKD
jgi:CDP-diglyceride synthetase